MSMKRSKSVSRGSRDEGDTAPTFLTPRAEAPTFAFDEHVASQPDDAFAPYALSSRYARGALVVHPKFGRGVVTAVDGPRIEVLFAEGSKKLGHAGP